MASIHDSLLTGYLVDGTGKTITLHTRPRAGGGEAFVDVVFRGVVAYKFDGDCFENVVFGIEEVPVDSVVGDGAAFDASFRSHGWPRGWDPRSETIGVFLKRLGAKIYELTCSYGMSGWVAATSMETVVQGRQA